MNEQELQKLATLARISVSSEELAALAGDMENILRYVSQISEAESRSSGLPELVWGFLREDKNPHESGIHTEPLLKAAPSTEDGFIKVKKILPL